MLNSAVPNREGAGADTVDLDLEPFFVFPDDEFLSTAHVSKYLREGVLELQ